MWILTKSEVRRKRDPKLRRQNNDVKFTVGQVNDGKPLISGRTFVLGRPRSSESFAFSGADQLLVSSPPVSSEFGFKLQ